MRFGRLRAGVAEAEITGKDGLRLARTLTPRIAKGKKTPLFAKASILSNGENDVAIVTLDLFGLGKHDCGRTGSARGK